jgi:hypothetical protein
VSGPQKSALKQVQRVPTRLGEQKPAGPQFESTRQLLAVSHRLAIVLALVGRHSHGLLSAQSASLVQVS